MIKEKRILNYVLGWLILGFTILFIGINNVLADTYETFDVTWYYRNKSNENNLLNVVKDEETPLYASTNEYVNGYTTRIEQSFNKDIQYVINYNLRMSFSPEQELNYRSDTLQRIIDYSFVDTDFKILNVTASENWNRSSSSGNTALTIKVSMQVIALNNTNAIRFGVYTTNNISIGFYNHTDQIDYYILDNININDNSNGTIIDQNNQIIQGQDDINQSIIDGNKETQDVIKDQFNTCRDSINLFNPNNLTNNVYILPNGSIETQNSFWLSDYIEVNDNEPYALNYIASGIIYYDENKNFIGINFDTKNFTTKNLTKYIRINYKKDTVTYENANKIMMNEGTSLKNFEPYGEEICSNKIDETNDKLDGIQGALTDSSSPNTGALANSAGWLPAGPLDSILNLPLTMLNSLTNSLEKTCSPLNIKLPYVNKNIQIPCLSAIFAKITGVNGLWSWVGTIASVLILYNYLLNLYAWVDRVLTLRAEFDEAMGADLANWGRL